MKLEIELVFNHGLVEKGDNNYYPPEYYLVNADNGEFLCDICFKTPEELEAYIATHYPECDRWVPPPAAPEEFAVLVRMLGQYDDGKLDDPYIKRVVRNILINKLYQDSYPDDVVARVRSAIDNLKE